MARGSTQAQTAGNTAAGLSSNLETQAGDLYGSLAPTLEAEAAHPAGFSPTDLAAMNTSAQQSAGGTQSAATGQGALLAARTRNLGGPDAAIASGARSAGEAASKRALDVTGENASLKQHQMQSGLTGLEHLYGEDLGAGLTASGQIAPDINANTGAENASWDWAKDILDPLISAGGGAGAAKLAGCWIAEAIYGIDDPRTALARAWLNGPFKTTRAGAVIMASYLRFGRAVAAVVRHSGILRSALKPLFDIAVRRACD